MALITRAVFLGTKSGWPRELIAQLLWEPLPLRKFWKCDHAQARGGRGSRPRTGCWQVWGVPRRPVSPAQAPRPAGSGSTDATSVWPKPRGRTPGFKGPRRGWPPGLLPGRAGPPAGPRISYTLLCLSVEVSTIWILPHPPSDIFRTNKQLTYLAAINHPEKPRFGSFFAPILATNLNSDEGPGTSAGNAGGGLSENTCASRHPDLGEPLLRVTCSQRERCPSVPSSEQRSGRPPGHRLPRWNRGGGGAETQEAQKPPWGWRASL